jgi:putative ABC transport system substrate-binding protein
MRLADFRKGLGETGHVEGHSVAIEYRWAENQNDRLLELATDLVRRRVNVIATPASTPAALAAKAATATIPIVFFVGVDPINAGLVATFNRPGGNITGVTTMNVQLGAKRLELLQELLPRAERFAVFINPKNPIADALIADAQAAAAAIGRHMEVLSASTAREIDAAFANLVQERVDALLVSPDALLIDRCIQVVTLASYNRVPTIYYDREFSDVGGLMSYGPSQADLFRQVGIYTGRILKGEKPADLPVLQPTKFELVINLQTARTLGIDVPVTLLARADEVIE